MGGVETSDALSYLTGLVDHELSSAGVSAGNVDGLSLEGARKVLDALGRPDQSFRSIHVTGTNGKGSVCLLAEALVRSSGLRVGTYLSPEGSVNERIRVDGQAVGDDDLAEAVISVRGAAEHLGVVLTAFEAITLSALVVLADAPVDVALIEVGLLGRFDATNVIDAEVAVVTNIGSDHTDFGPRWRERIADEKAGIIRPGGICVLGRIDDELVDIFRAERPASLRRIEHDFDCVTNDLAVGGRVVAVVTSIGTRVDASLPVHGVHQGENFAIAAEATEAILGQLPDDEVIAAALEELEVPGRIEVVSIDPMVVIDGAHNAEAAASLGAALSESFSVAGRRTLVLGSLKGRDPLTVYDAINEEFPVDVVVAVGASGERGLTSAEVAHAVSLRDVAVITARNGYDGVLEAVRGADIDDIVVVAGTFRTHADVRAAVSSEDY